MLWELLTTISKWHTVAIVRSKPVPSRRVFFAAEASWLPSVGSDQVSWYCCSPVVAQRVTVTAPGRGVPCSPVKALFQAKVTTPLEDWGKSEGWRGWEGVWKEGISEEMGSQSRRPPAAYQDYIYLWDCVVGRVAAVRCALLWIDSWGLCEGMEAMKHVTWPSVTIMRRLFKTRHNLVLIKDLRTLIRIKNKLVKLGTLPSTDTLLFRFFSHI